MAKPSRDDDDDHVTDLARYRKAREQAARKQARPPRPPSESFLGSNPRAGLILLIIAVVLLALWLGPRFL